MNRTKITQTRDINKYVNALSKVMPRNNGTQGGIDALAESLKRGDAYVQAQRVLNEKCLPERKVQLSNTFLVKGVSHE